MNDTTAALRVDAERLRARFDALAAIGATGDGGVHRPALGQDHLRARQWFLDEGRAIGLDTHVDGAGNHSATLACGQAGAPALLLGSHLDSVRHGGRFDGALGVLAALEALQVVKEAGLELDTNLEAIDFTDEEGTHLGFLGSLAVTGALTADELGRPGSGVEVFQAALAGAELTDTSILSAARDPKTIAGYLELHIEQGNRLNAAVADIGVVTGIVGLRRQKVTYIGRADHAGTISMTDRLDAGQGAAGLMLAARSMVMTAFPDSVVNIGVIAFEPGAMNVVPERACLTLEFRAPVAEDLERLGVVLKSLVRAEAKSRNLEAEVEEVDGIQPVQLDQRAQGALAGAATRIGLKQIAMPSGAGHDAQAMARICPAGMIFVPSAGGFSHSAREFTEWDDCVNGANVLLQAAVGGL
ncbi:MAG: Zn-dependent hydrolase [Vicinamibacterales bacterium]|jgi:N-carbamoyl-L-amino-acid hydrolase|nr:Zn-dependent hydrolase [Vicinamibacterales bacterium]MDP7473145.1 Zn-dependent hydrolase [Vicinamibacterales bacterium]MDP7670490.1 Zn-dependent hydrolase [Vicinamibacterales bacterium]HJO38148.1 Zn-dependent hydrolase [Vicinamibacterales bacterium]